MVRSLTTTLRAAVNSSSRRPYLTASAQDHIQHFASYQTPAGQDAYNDTCIAGDESIIRVYLSRSGNAFQQALFWQRITDPTQATQWSSWTAYTGGNGNMFQDGYCAVSNNSGTLRAFAQQGNGGNALWNWYSTNNGAGWSGNGTVCTPPGGALIKGIASSGNNDVFFIYDVSGGEAIGGCFYTGAWSTIHNWTLGTIGYGGGLDVIYANGVYNIFYSDTYAIKSCTYNPTSNTWAAGQTIAPSTTTALGRISPRIFYDSSALGGAGLYSLVCTEVDGGAITGSVYNYPRIRQSIDLVHWSNGFIAHDITTQYGACMFFNVASGIGRYFLASTIQVDMTPGYVGSATQYQDVSASITRYMRQEATRKASKLELWLDNNLGQFDALVATAGHYGEPIALNTSIVLNEGYYTGTPPVSGEVVQVNQFHINRLEFARNPEENTLYILAYDLSRRLDLVSRYQYTWFNETIAWLIAEVCTRAGLFQFSLPATTQMSETITTFTLHAGQTYRATLNELCDTYALDYFLDQAEILQFRELSSGDASIWSYQPEIETVTFGSDDLRGNHIIVSGKPPAGGFLGALTTAEAYDDTHNTIVGEERVIHKTDAKLLSTTQCALKAAFLMAQEQRSEIAHTVTVPANPALQLLDVVTLNDMNAPTGSNQSGNARIIGQIVHFQAQHALYEQQLKLEGV